MLYLEGCFLIETYAKAGATGTVASEKNHLKSPNISGVQSFLVRARLPLTQGAGSAVAAFCSASAKPWSVPALTQITSQPVWKVTAHKYLAASPGRRFPRAAVLALCIQPSCAGKR